MPVIELLIDKILRPFHILSYYFSYSNHIICYSHVFVLMIPAWIILNCDFTKYILLDREAELISNCFIRSKFYLVMNFSLRKRSIWVSKTKIKYKWREMLNLVLVLLCWEWLSNVTSSPQLWINTYKSTLLHKPMQFRLSFKWGKPLAFHFFDSDLYMIVTTNHTLWLFVEYLPYKYTIY
jgi:hypothetical protein